MSVTLKMPSTMSQGHQFSQAPQATIERSTFDRSHGYKTTFNAGDLIPFLVDEVLPGDTYNVSVTALARLNTPLRPIMDNMHLDIFFFFVPNRLLWTNWQKFCGEQLNPGDSTSYTIPVTTVPAAGYVVGRCQDYLGFPVGIACTAASWTHSALPARAYYRIYNEWFRDENLCSRAGLGDAVGDGPDVPVAGGNTIMKRGKRHDYFTSCLPWPQKGTAVSIPLGTTAPIFATGTTALGAGTPGATGTPKLLNSVGVNNIQITASAGGAMLQADLANATAATINSLRQAFQIQKMLERDARGGTRYVELLKAHFGVTSPDARLQRPEYLGGGSTPVVVNPIAQTSGTSASGTTTPLGHLSAMGTALASGHGFTQSFTEHGVVIGLVSVRADLTYQQGLRRMWSRSTRYDFYFPAFAMLGEQAVLNKEIYCDGSANDANVFGYQERWAEYRYHPSQVSGLFKSTSSGTIDGWHLAQKFTALPTLNTTFIQDTPPVSRVVAVGASANGQQFLFDSFFDVRKARCMPLYSVPGLIDHL